MLVIQSKAKRLATSREALRSRRRAEKRQHGQEERLAFVKAHTHGPNRISESELASRFNCDVRTIRRDRRKLKDRVDPGSRARTQKRKHRERDKRHRKRKVWLDRILSNVELDHGTAQQAPLSRESINSLQLVAQFLGLLPTMFQFIAFGGSRELLNWNCVADMGKLLPEVIDTFLPAKRDQIIWIYPLAGRKSVEQIRAEINRIAADDTTVAWAIHLPDALHSFPHVHVLSRAALKHEQAALSQLRKGVGASGYNMCIRKSGAMFMRYMDCNSKRDPSANGIKFGPAAPPEVRILQNLAAVETRGSLVIGERNVNGAYDVAEYLYNRKLNRVEPLIPDSWDSMVQHYLDKSAPLAQMGPQEGSKEHQIPVRIKLAWTELKRVSAAPVQPRAAFLGRPEYYRSAVEVVEMCVDKTEYFASHFESRLEYTRVDACVLPPSMDEFHGLGIRDMADLDLYQKVCCTPRFEACTLNFGLCRFALGSDTYGDHRPYSPYEPRRLVRDMVPMELARIVDKCARSGGASTPAAKLPEGSRNGLQACDFPHRKARR